MCRKILILTHRPMTPEEIQQTVESAVAEGFNHFICFAKSLTDLQIIDALKQLDGVGVELVGCEDNLELSPEMNEKLYQGCKEFCLLENVAKDKSNQMRYLRSKAQKVLEL